MSFVLDVHQDASLLEMFEVRRILEPAAAGLAAGRVTDADIAHLEGLLADASAARSVDELVASDIVFHRFIAQRAGNSCLTGLFENLSSSTLRARLWRGMTEEGTVERTLTEHRAIVAALARHDAVLVAAHATVQSTASPSGSAASSAERPETRGHGGRSEPSLSISSARHAR